jgi:hypothetical protein
MFLGTQIQSRRDLNLGGWPLTQPVELGSLPNFLGNLARYGVAAFFTRFVAMGI